MKHICETIFKWVSSICLWATKRENEMEEKKQTQKRKHIKTRQRNASMRSVCVVYSQCTASIIYKHSKRWIHYGRIRVRVMVRCRWWQWQCQNIQHDANDDDFLFFFGQYFSKLFVCHFNKQILLPPEQEKTSARRCDKLRERKSEWVIQCVCV